MKNSMLKIMTLLVVMLFTATITASAHCDTMDGPVVKASKAAIEKADVTLVLKWIKKDHEHEVRQAFQKTLEVRKGGLTAKELADMYFFETVVRLHRAGEGEPYTGIKPVGTPVEPIVQNADQALEQGDIKVLAKQLTSSVEEEITKRFQRALEIRKDADKSVESGREFVEAYVGYVHYAEQLFEAIHKEHAEHGNAAESEEKH
jgi:hypothetical protein